MKENRPIYYCCGLDYEPYPVADIEDYMGEENDDLSYDIVEIKTGKEIRKFEYHNVPYFPAIIDEFEANPEDFLNLSHVGYNYEVDYSISLDTYQKAYNELLAGGTSPEDITASSLSEYVSENTMGQRAA